MRICRGERVESWGNRLFRGKETEKKLLAAAVRGVHLSHAALLGAAEAMTADDDSRRWGEWDWWGVVPTEERVS
jgi:hypothetical protein